MGKNNRQRRADKRRERARSSSSGPGTHDGYRPGGGSDPPSSGLGERELAQSLIFEAAEASEGGDQDVMRSALDALVGLQDRSRSGAAAVSAAMSSCLMTAVRSGWEGGWQPADIVKAAAKRLGGRHADLAAQLIAAEARTSTGSGVNVPDAWAAQLADLDAGAEWDALAVADFESLPVACALLGLLISLPVLPHLLPPPSRWGKGFRATTRQAGTVGRDDRILARIRALLAKAESTEFEAEADALTAKAQELMTRHAIDQAMLSGDVAGEFPSGRRIWMDDPYAVGKSFLLGAVAGANRCRAVWMESYGFSTVFGFSGDLDNVDMLYTSLLVQATRAMTAAGSVRDASGRSRTRSFRSSFLLAFARRIGERLRAASAAATEEAGAVHGGALLPVLAGRDSAVEDARDTAFPHLVATRMRASNYAGWIAGRLAADRAHLGYGQALPGLAG